MRLLNCTTLEFCEFFDSNIPKYAILSHRWGSDEASFQDFERGMHPSREGFAKIRKCCDVAKKNEYEWAWVDTCCIDKKSSAELTEAINSMYTWYKKAETCYVYLVDVSWETGNIDAHQASKEGFRQSSWFTRGWTLQELLAPRIVWFFDHDWHYIGSKDDLVHEISDITGIDTEYLQPPTAEVTREQTCTRSVRCRGHLPYSNYRLTGRWEPSVATRMSWASKRQTSRIEDTAYCLLGLFHVNMPLLYGEGSKAFIRLQHEIIKNTSDESIFAWTDDKEVSGVLARWPANFANSRYVHELPPSHRKRMRAPCTITNQGLELPVTWRAWTLSYSNRSILNVMLECGTCGPQGFKYMVLSLVRWSRMHWTRVFSNRIVAEELKKYGQWYNRQDLELVSNPFAAIERSYASTSEDRRYGLSKVMVTTDWIEEDNDMHTSLTSFIRNEATASLPHDLPDRFRQSKVSKI